MVTDEICGTINYNSNFGIFGNITSLNSLQIDTENEMEIALRSEIEKGAAFILSDISGEIKKYKIEVEKIYLNDTTDNKSFAIKVVDEDLINLTGGIIRGLSGSPIIQNGKIIGIVTNVLVSNPCLGFGVFADLVLENMEVN